MTQAMAIGAPSYGGKKKNNWRLKDGSNIYRLLPPIGKLAAEGVWAVYEALHWGYRGTKGMRPFKCIQKKDFKTKMIRVQCPECDKIAEKTALKDQTVAAKKAEGFSEDQANEFVKPLTDWLFSHNLDKKWYVNAMDKDGAIGRLALPHKMYAQLQLKIESLLKEGVDPIAIEGGVYFDFQRSGKGRDVTFAVGVVEEMVDIGGRKMKTYKPAQLTNDHLARLSSEAYDLAESFRSLTYDEIKRIVGSNGDTDIVDAIFSGPESRNAAQAEVEDDGAPEPGTFGGTNVAAAAVSVPAPAPATVLAAVTAPAVVAAAAAPIPVDPQAALQAQLAALQAQLAALQAPAAVKPAAAPATVVAAPATVVAAPATVVAAPATVVAKPAVTEMNDDDFIRAYGMK